MAPRRGPFARLFGGAPASASSPVKPFKPPRPDDRAVLQVGGAAFDATVALRVELWMSVLHRAGGAGARAGRSYGALLERGPADAATADLIAKDATRTFPALPRRAFDPAALERVLRAYAASDPEVGYMQGLNFLAGLLLLHIPSEPAAFGLLSVLLLERGLRALYVDGMSALQARLWQLGRLLDAPLSAHLEAVGAPTVLWAAPWFLTCFASTFPVGVAARTVDVLLGGTPVRAPVLAVARAFARLGAAAALAAHDMEGAVAALRDGVPRMAESRLHEAMTDALCSAWTPAELAALDSVDGPAYETVAATVARLADGGDVPAAASDDGGDAPRPRPALRWAASEPAAIVAGGRLAPPPSSPGVGRGRASAPVGDLLSGGGGAAADADAAPSLPGRGGGGGAVAAAAAAPSPAPRPALLTTAASLRLADADAALPPAEAAAELLSALSAAAPPAAAAPLPALTLPLAPHAAAAAALAPITGGDRRGRPLPPPHGGSDDWGAFASADREPSGEGGSGRGGGDSVAARVASALESWGPFASAGESAGE